MPRPAARAEVREEPRMPIRDPNRVRVRKHAGNVDQFWVDMDAIPDGLSVEWKRASVFGQEDRQYMATMMDQGWEPVDAGMLNPGESGPVERGGLILMERPMELTLQARAEAEALAREAVRTSDKEFKAASQVDPNARATPKLRTQVSKTYGPIEVAE